MKKAVQISLGIVLGIWTGVASAEGLTCGSFEYSGSKEEILEAVCGDTRELERDNEERIELLENSYLTNSALRRKVTQLQKSVVLAAKKLKKAERRK